MENMMRKQRQNSQMATSPVQIKERVYNRKYDKNENIYEGKQAEFLDDTSPDQMEEGVNDINDNRN